MGYYPGAMQGVSCHQLKECGAVDLDLELEDPVSHRMSFFDCKITIFSLIADP